jgi:hypothetical protein
MLRGIVSVTWAGLLLAASAAFAQEPPRQLDAFKALVGDWTCQGRTLGEGTHPFQATMRVTSEFGGTAYVERYEEAASAEHARPFKTINLLTYDPGVRRYVRTGLDNTGRLHGATSAGWQANRWIWEGEGVRVPLIRKGPDALELAMDVRKDGDWVAVSEATCTR